MNFPIISRRVEISYLARAMGGLLRSKVGVVFGVSNARSLAWGVARAWADAGSRVHVVCQSERFVGKVEAMVADEAPRSEGGIAGVHVCNVSDDGQIAHLFEALARDDEALRCGAPLDAVLHAVAHASPKAMKEGTLLDTRRVDFAAAHDVSAYSLIALARGAAPLMDRRRTGPGDDQSDARGPGGSITALTYLGSSAAVPGYNVMGCAKASLEAAARGLALELGPRNGTRVNCLSPGPVSTLASRGIRDFVDLKTAANQKSPLGRTATNAEVGAAAVFLASDGAAAVTGQVIFLDGGLSSVAPL
jgi:enoyl-[acyl-carrier protein] reductase I